MNILVQAKTVLPTLALAALAVLMLSGCERRMDTPSVEFYLAHPDQREATQLSCVKEPEKHRSMQDCANAAAAQDLYLAQYLPPAP